MRTPLQINFHGMDTSPALETLIRDKTQVATVALAAQYSSFVQVVAGTTLGMMIANAPVVLFGDRIAAWMPVRTIQRAAAALFLLLGALVLLGVGIDRPAG